MEEFKVPNAVAKLPPKSIDEENGSLNVKALNKDVPSTPNPPAAICPYKEPKWSGCPPEGVEYHFEVLKMGQIIDEVKCLHKKGFWVFGRLPGNDIEMAHPTVSRFHAILQYRPKIDEETTENKKQIEEGWYIYDLGSTHGTFLNKQRIPPQAYIRVKVGHMLRLGASMRSYILQGPEFDEEPECEMSVSELKQMRANEEAGKKKTAAMQLETREREGITWGMADDAEEETDLSVNPYASTNNEELFLDDPKKTLRGFFEREGLDLEYKCDEMSVGTFVCRIELPVDDLNGKRITAEVCHKGKKKECVVQCALEACRILDRHGVLRQANHEPLKRKIQAADSDEEDDFFDRTGDVERKKMRKSIPVTNVALTYEDLLSQEKEVLVKIKEIQEKITKYQELSKRVREAKNQQVEDLDSFMENLNDESTILDKTDIRRLRIEEKELQADHQKIKRMIQIAKPLDLPAISPLVSTTNPTDSAKKPRQLPIIGKRNQFSFKTLQPQKNPVREKPVEKELKSDEEEIEDEEERDGSDKTDEKSLKLMDSKKQNEDETEDEKQIPDKPDDKSTLLEVPEKKFETEDAPKLYGPAIIPETFKAVSSDEKEHNEEMVNDESPIATAGVEISTTNESNSSNSKKKRPRQRIRGKRENVDIEDEEDCENTEKYSKWVPPENQSGDGITSLNDKFGY